MEFESERVARGLDGGGDEDGNTICHRRDCASKARKGFGGRERERDALEYYCPDRRGYKKLSCQTRNQTLADMLLWVVPQGKKGRGHWLIKRTFRSSVLIVADEGIFMLFSTLKDRGGVVQEFRFQQVYLEDRVGSLLFRSHSPFI